MNNLFNEVFGTSDAERKTLIEIALGVDEAGKTTAKRLYSFLDLNPGNNKQKAECICTCPACHYRMGLFSISIRPLLFFDFFS